MACLRSPLQQYLGVVHLLHTCPCSAYAILILPIIVDLQESSRLLPLSDSVRWDEVGGSVLLRGAICRKTNLVWGTNNAEVIVRAEVIVGDCCRVVLGSAGLAGAK